MLPRGSLVTPGTAPRPGAGHSRSVRSAIFRKLPEAPMPLRRAGGTLAVALLAGCAGLPGYLRDPDVNLQRLDVEDSHVGEVEYDSGFQSQKGDTTVLTLPLSFTWTGLAGAARTALNSGELPYTLKGQLTVA